MTTGKYAELLRQDLEEMARTFRANPSHDTAAPWIELAGKLWLKGSKFMNDAAYHVVLDATRKYR